MKKTAARSLALIAMLALTLTAMLMAFESVALDDRQYRSAMERVGSVEAAGLTGGDLDSVLANVAGYLQGRYFELYATATIDGARQPVFNEREIDHMRDVAALFGRAHDLAWTALPIATLLCGMLAIRLCLPKGLGRRAPVGEDAIIKKEAPVVDARAIGRMLGGALALAALIWVAAFGLAALWALADFNGAFTAFHHMLFTNDLWLLDPATDRMIRMFPEPFFIDIAARIGLRIGGVLACAGLLGGGAYMHNRRGL